MGINFQTGVRINLTDRKDRDYPDDDDFFYGTADIVAILKSGALLIADWKTGMSDGAEEQLKSLALMALPIMFEDFPEKVPQVRIAVLTATEEDGVLVHEREVPWAELSAHYDSVRDAIAKARSTSKPSLPVVGTYCTQQYCPHLAKCPATKRDMDKLAGSGDGTGSDEYEFTEHPSSEHHAGWMAMRMRAVKRAMTYYDGALKDHVRSGKRAIYNGYEWSETGNGFRIKKL